MKPTTNRNSTKSSARSLRGARWCVVALMASTLVAVAPATANAATPGGVTLTPAGSTVDCATSLVTIGLAISYAPSDDIVSVEIDGATMNVDGAIEDVVSSPQDVRFTPSTLMPESPTATASVVSRIGHAVTFDVRYTVNLADGSRADGQAGLVLDPARPADVCPGTSTTTDVAPAPTTVTPNVPTAGPARPKAAQPRFTG